VQKDFKDILDIVPIPWNYDKDGNCYITAGIVVAKDPETGKVNTAIQRLMYRGGRELNIFFAPMQRNWMIFNKYKAVKRICPSPSSSAQVRPLCLPPSPQEFRTKNEIGICGRHHGQTD